MLFRSSLQARGVTPGLATVLVGDDPASRVYIRNKARACEQAGVASIHHDLPASASEQDVLNLVERLNNDPKVHGTIVQLPLPRHLNAQCVSQAIAYEKDVDGFNTLNLGKVAQEDPSGFVACTPAGIMELLARSGVDLKGKHVVVLGRSLIVGKPVALLALQKRTGANGTVTICHSATRDLPAITRLADVLIAAIGRPEFVTADMVKPAAVVIDVGINRVPDPSRKTGYRLTGDVAFGQVAPLCSKITPVPGGVGPMTVAMLMRNTVEARLRRTQA